METKRTPIRLAGPPEVMKVLLEVIQQLNIGHHNEMSESCCPSGVDENGDEVYDNLVDVVSVSHHNSETIVYLVPDTHYLGETWESMC